MGQERLSSLVVLDEVVDLVCHQTLTEAGARGYSEVLLLQCFNVSFYIVKLVLYKQLYSTNVIFSS